MKIITPDEGRVLQIIAADEIRPVAGIAMPALLRAFVERYQFVGMPANLAEATRSSIKYTEGQFSASDGVAIAIKEFSVYRDGFMVSCQTTNYAETVMDDMWRLLFSMGFRKPVTEKPKTYTSGVIVQFDSEMNNAISGFEKLSKIIPGALGNRLNKTIEPYLFKLAFQADPTTVPQYTNTEFYFERRIDTPYSKNCFFAAAPLSTDEHIAFLAEFERTVLAK